jgi:hypothetical protein
MNITVIQRTETGGNIIEKTATIEDVELNDPA